MDRQMRTCLSCGHDLGIGRFCVNCGHPLDTPVVDDVSTTAERPRLPPDPAAPPVPPAQASRGPVPPPPVYEPPRPPRFPLFADESPSTPVSAGSAPTSGSTPPPVPATSDPLLLEPAADHRRRPSGLVSGAGWVVAAAAVIILLGVGGTLLIRGSGGDSPDSASAGPGTLETSAPTDSPSDGPSGSPSDGTDSDPTPDPTPSGGVGEGDDPTPEAPVDVARLAEASPPDTASPSRDVNGNAVRYEAFNMLDGQADTAWRMPGDGSGQEIVFRLDAPTKIVGVGLINGYAKVDPGYDGYAANRRITRVEWVFGDGTVVPQDLNDDPTLQRVEVDGIVSDTVTLHILEVSGPAKGPSGRDYTAISDVALVGTPA